MADTPEPMHEQNKDSQPLQLNTEDSALEMLSLEQRGSLSPELQAVFLTLNLRDQEFAAKTFTPHDLPVFLTRKKAQIAQNKAQKQRLAEIEARMTQATQAAAQNADNSQNILGGIAAAAGLGAAAAAASQLPDTGSWTVESPQKAIEAALRRLQVEFGGKERTELEIQRSGDPAGQYIVHAVIGVIRRSRNEPGWNPGRDLIPALDITLASNKAVSEVHVEVGELDKETLIDAAKSLSRKGFNVLKRGATSILRKGRLDAGDMIDMAGATLETAFDLGQAMKDLDLKKRTWTCLGEVFTPLEQAYTDLVQKTREQDAQAIEIWDRYLKCPTCGVAFMSEDTQCRVCDTARPAKPSIRDPRNQVK